MKRGLRYASFTGVVMLVLIQYWIYSFYYFIYITRSKPEALHYIFFLLATVGLILLLISFYELTQSNPGYLQSENDKLVVEDEEEQKEIKNSSYRHYNEIAFVKELIKGKTNKTKTVEPRLEKFRLFDKQHLKKELEVLYVKSTQIRLFCFHCQHIKPLRAHHCSICNCCVERLDHHCLVVNKCIGKRNMIEFVRFLGYCLFACFIVFMNETIFYFGSHSLRNLNYTLFDFYIIFNCGSCLLFFCLLGLMFFSTFRNILRNITAIEDRNEYFEYKNPFDRGVKANFDIVFGELGILQILMPGLVYRLIRRYFKHSPSI